ncbi:uncharacterized protein LOC132203044 [Neocloeon triangulifer]|uniref:uncharacterized protein LOC132203044 n=1 Tax=Neocloeon triangulifer TaxID=2078957 RepID=UPI00286F32A4|nr:uncharacterized protein LOC132203044 [Neocloeon triangulifer]
MEPTEDVPQIQSATLEDFPTRAVSEYFNSTFCGIFKSSAPHPKWNIVPKSSQQNLIDTLISDDKNKSEIREKENEYQGKVALLDKQWADVGELESHLKEAFLETEEKIEDLRKCELANGKSAACDVNDLLKEIVCLKKREEYYVEDTKKITDAIQNMDEDIDAQSHFMDFAEKVAAEQTSVYSSGALSVLQHYERLKSAHRDVTVEQENTLMRLGELGQEMKKFNSSSSESLDALETTIQEVQTQVANQTIENKEQEKLITTQRGKQRIKFGEVKIMEDAIRCMFEASWKRYHEPMSEAPIKNIKQQSEYIQLTMASLENLICYLKKANPKSRESVSPQLSESETNPKNTK